MTLDTDDVMSQDDIESVITQYERQFGMTSEEFLQKCHEGTAPDTYEAMDWAILLKHYRLEVTEAALEGGDA